MIYYLTAFFASLLISFFLTPLIIKIAHKFSLVDNREKRKKTTQIHKGTIPRAGGLSIGIAFFLGTLLFVPLSKNVIGILTAALTAVLVGLLDDIKESSPYSRFIANFFTAGIIVIGGVSIPFITNPFNGILRLDTFSYAIDFLGEYSFLPLASLAAVFWIVWTMNIVGWSGGVDGQLPGLVTIAAIIIGLLSFRFSAHDISQNQVALLSFLTAGAFAGFLPWNFYPQKIMPGYSGKSLAGLLLATLAILSGAKLGTALIVLSIPMADAFFTVIRRISKGKSPFYPDKGHFHHKLLERGWGKRRIALFYWATTAFFGILALNLSSTQGKFFAGILIITIVFMTLLWLHYATKKDSHSSTFSA